MVTPDDKKLCLCAAGAIINTMCVVTLGMAGLLTCNAKAWLTEQPRALFSDIEYIIATWVIGAVIGYIPLFCIHAAANHSIDDRRNMNYFPGITAFFILNTLGILLACASTKQKNHDMDFWPVFYFFIPACAGFLSYAFHLWLAWHKVQQPIIMRVEPTMPFEIPEIVIVPRR